MDKTNMFEEISDALKPVFNKFDGVMEQIKNVDKDRQLKELKKRLKKAYQKLGKIEYGYNCLNKFDVIDKYPCQRINHLRDKITSLKQQIKELK